MYLDTTRLSSTRQCPALREPPFDRWDSVSRCGAGENFPVDPFFLQVTPLAFHAAAPPVGHAAALSGDAAVPCHVAPLQCEKFVVQSHQFVAQSQKVVVHSQKIGPHGEKGVMPRQKLLVQRQKYAAQGWHSLLLNSRYPKARRVSAAPATISVMPCRARQPASASRMRSMRARASSRCSCVAGSSVRMRPVSISPRSVSS